MRKALWFFVLEAFYIIRIFRFLGWFLNFHEGIIGKLVISLKCVLFFTDVHRFTTLCHYERLTTDARAGECFPFPFVHICIH